jgi:hypothetical protein
MSLFTSTRTAPVEDATFAAVWERNFQQTLSTEDSNTAAAWQLTAWQWTTLTEVERVNLRDRIAFAPALKTGK